MSHISHHLSVWGYMKLDSHVLLLLTILLIILVDVCFGCSSFQPPDSYECWLWWKNYSVGCEYPVFSCPSKICQFFQLYLMNLYFLFFRFGKASQSGYMKFPVSGWSTASFHRKWLKLHYADCIDAPHFIFLFDGSIVMVLLYTWVFTLPLRIKIS